MAKSKVVSYTDKNYQQSGNIYDTLAQCLDEFKYNSVHSVNSWNMPTNEIQGVTMSLVGENNVRLIYHRYKVGTVEEVAKSNMEEEGQKFLKDVVKELKKKFKSKTDKALTMKEVEVENHTDKASRISAETSFIAGSNGRPVGRFLIRDVALYEISASL